LTTPRHDLARIARAAIDANSYLTSQPLTGTAQAVYLTVTAAEVTAEETQELIRGIGVFSARSQERLGKPSTSDDVRAPSALRLYRASVSELWVVDGFDPRLRVELEDLAEPGRLPAGGPEFQQWL
jgi:hypothetical protein